MSELESQERRQLTPSDYLLILRRRLWWILVPGLLGPIIAYGISLKLPSRYTSRTLVLVEEPKVPDSYVKSVVSEFLGARLATMQEQILSRSRLQPIVERFGLYADRAGASLDDKIELAKTATEVKPVRPDFGGGESAIQGFTISFTAAEPKIAQQVCAELTSMFMEENLKVRSQRAQGTTDFLVSQLGDAKRNLDEQDSKLAAFKRKYMGQLPGEDQSNFNILMSLNGQLDAATQAISQLQQNRTYTEAMLNSQLQAWQSAQASNGGSLGPETLQQQLSKEQAQLADLRSKYTDTYPDVVRLKNDIAELQRKIEAEPDLPKTPVKESKAGSEPSQLLQLRLQLAAINQSIKDKQRDQAKIQQQIQTLQSRIQLSPVVEEDYKHLTRDYQTALEFYNDLLKKRSQSEMSTDLERRQEGEQFRVMDPPNLPERPTFPNRPRFAAVGLAGGLAMGLGLVFLMEFTKKALRDERDVSFYLQLPTLAMVPDLDAEDSKTGRTKLFRKARADRKLKPETVG